MTLVQKDIKMEANSNMCFAIVCSLSEKPCLSIPKYHYHHDYNGNTIKEL